jgi:hypothetical protein
MKTLILTLLTVFSLNGFAQDRGLDELFESNRERDGIETATHVVLGTGEIIGGLIGAIGTFIPASENGAFFAKKSKLSRKLIGAGFALMLVDGVYRLVLLAKDGEYKALLSYDKNYYNPGLSPILTIAFDKVEQAAAKLEELFQDKGEALDGEEISSVLMEYGVDIEGVNEAVMDSMEGKSEMYNNKNTQNNGAAVLQG